MESENAKKYISSLIEIVKIAVIAFVIVTPIRYFLFQPFVVSGESMAPNFYSGDYLIINEISYRFSEPQRGDVVVFSASFLENYQGQRFIKRIIGLPGETISVDKGIVSINKDGKGQILNEDYLPKDLETYGNVKVTLNANEYFVLGDNRPNSYDSRMWGVVDKKYIIGKAFLRILPVTNMKIYE